MLSFKPTFSLSSFTFLHWRRKWQLTQCSCLENPRDGGAWWAAVYRVAQSDAAGSGPRLGWDKQLTTCVPVVPARMALGWCCSPPPRGRVPAPEAVPGCGCQEHAFLAFLLSLAEGCRGLRWAGPGWMRGSIPNSLPQLLVPWAPQAPPLYCVIKGPGVCLLPATHPPRYKLWVRCFAKPAKELP